MKNSIWKEKKQQKHDWRKQVKTMLNFIIGFIIGVILGVFMLLFVQGGTR